MVKLVSKFGVGLALGALAGHYLSTEKGQAHLAQLKEELLSLKENPQAYKSDLLARAKGLVADQLQAAYDNKDDIMAAFGQEADQEGELSSESEDIIITYTEDDIESHSEDL